MVDAAEFRNLVVGTGFLAGELVAREADNHQTLVLILLVERLQAVVLRGEAAFGSGIDNHQDFAFELGEIHFGAPVALGLEIVNLCHGVVRIRVVSQASSADRSFQ